MSPVFGFNTDIRHGDTVYHVQTEAREADLTVQTAIFVRGRCIDKQACSYAQEASLPGFSEANVHQMLTNQHKFVVNCIREGKLESLSSMGLAGRIASVAPANSNGDSKHPLPDIEAFSSSQFSTTPVSTHVSAGQESEADDVDILGVTTEQLWSHQVSTPSREPEPVPAPKNIEPPPELKLEWLSAESVFKGESVTLRYRLTLGSRGIEGAKIVARLEVGGVPSAYARTVSDVEGEAEVSFKLSAAAQSSTALSITVQASHAGKSTARRFRLSRS